jgi:hypothetical protein
MGGSSKMLFYSPPPACRPSIVVPLANAASVSKAAGSPTRVLPSRRQKRRQNSLDLSGVLARLSRRDGPNVRRPSAP